MDGGEKEGRMGWGVLGMKYFVVGVVSGAPTAICIEGHAGCNIPW